MKAKHHAYRGGPYVYPFPSKATTITRTDQGVDFGGSGSILAIGRAKILKTHSPWEEYEGGAGILYQLLEGPYKGRAVYVYEGVNASVKPGQEVQAGQNIGTITPGTSSGIETGWADPHSGQPISHGEWPTPGETPTRGGKAFKSFIGGLPKSYGPSKPGRGGIPSASEEAGQPGIPGLNQASEVESEVESTLNNGILNELFKEIHPESLMLNIGLVGGGAFLVYYGAALMLGVRKPVGTPAKAATAAAAKGAA